MTTKRFVSQVLDETLTVPVTMHALRCIDKAGGFDNYILHTKARVRGLLGTVTCGSCARWTRRCTCRCGRACSTRWPGPHPSNSALCMHRAGHQTSLAVRARLVRLELVGRGEGQHAVVPGALECRAAKPRRKFHGRLCGTSAGAAQHTHALGHSSRYLATHALQLCALVLSSRRSARPQPCLDEE